MKKTVLYLVVLCMAMLTVGCGNGDPRDGFNKKPPTPIGGFQTPTPKPRTAEGPAALNRSDVAHASGVTETWTDPQTGRTCTVVEDLGSDGVSVTKNCYDENGKLVWWESFEYDEKSVLIGINRRSAAGNALIFHKDVSWDKGAVAMVSFFEPFRGNGNSGQTYMVYRETYYPNGTVQSRTNYYPYDTYSDYYVESIYEYKGDGTEIRHETFAPGGPVKQADTAKTYDIPDSVKEMFELLFKAADEDIDGIFTACRKKVVEKDMEQEWDSFTGTFSALIDLQYDAELNRLRNTYKLILFDKDRKSALYRNSVTETMKYLQSYVSAGTIKPALRERLYRENSFLAIPGTLWLSEEYQTAIAKAGRKPERTEGEPIRVLVVDSSESITGAEINMTTLSEESNLSGKILDRAETLVRGLFEEYAGSVILTSYPAEADVLLEIDAEYPFAQMYGKSFETGVYVYNTKVTLTATNLRGTDEAVVHLDNIAGETITVSTSQGVLTGMKVYMNLPVPTDDPYRADSQQFTQTILSWFPDVKQGK